jgi:hypothetical protein
MLGSSLGVTGNSIYLGRKLARLFDVRDSSDVEAVLPFTGLLVD